MKMCNKCGIVKRLSEFYRMVGMREGHRNDCKRCNLDAKAKRHRDNPEPGRERAKQWKIENPERAAAKEAAYRASGRKGLADRRSHLKRKYGITPEHYDTLMAEQGGVCAICGRLPTPGISLHLDHDHETGRIRGLLCFRCNNALGDFDDSATLLEAAIDYVVDHHLKVRLEGLLRSSA